MKTERIALYSNDYMTLFSDGELGLSDGVGYCGSLDRKEIEDLYEAILKLKVLEVDKNKA